MRSRHSLGRARWGTGENDNDDVDDNEIEMMMLKMVALKVIMEMVTMIHNFML